MMNAWQLGRAGKWLAAAACAALAACMALALAGCSGGDERAREALTQGIQEDMAQLTDLTSQTAAQLFAIDYTAELQAAGVDPAAVYGPLFERLSYQIDGIEVADDTATVMLTVTNRDLTAALQNYTDALTDELATQSGRDALAALDEAALTRHMAEVLVNCVRDQALGTVSNTVELVYAKSGAAWELQDGTALARALLGGLDTTATGQAAA